MNMCGNTHVPDKLEGYLLQVRHALFELISVDDRIVSVEAYDDVAVETNDEIIAEQTKSVLSNNNPAANRAVVFWKTLKNWCEYLKSGELPNKKIILRYVVVANSDLTIGSIPRDFANAKSEDDAAIALDAARLELFGNGTTEDRPPLGEKVKEFVDYCFAMENRATMLRVICSMDIDLHENTYDDELRTCFNRQIIPIEYSENLFVSMLGWINNRVHEQTKQNKPAFISSEEYRKELGAQVRSRDIRHILTAVSVQPETSRTTAEVNRHDTYIKQLELIDADTTKVFEVAADFLHAKAEQTEWAKKGIVTEESVSEYFNGLERMWKSNRTIVMHMPIDDENGRGNTLLAMCEKDSRGQQLQGATTPNFFGPGSLHSLANEPSTHPAIGWHPRYADLLKEMEDDA